MTKRELVERLIASGNFDYWDDSLIVETVTRSEIHVISEDYIEPLDEETSVFEFKKNCLDFILDDINDESEPLENKEDIQSKSNYFKDVLLTLEMLDEALGA